MDWMQGIGGRTVDGFWRSVFAPVQQWFDQHPWLEWLVQHPLWLVGLVLLVIFLFAGLIQAIGRLTENIWLMVLLLPFRLVSWLFLGTVWMGRFLVGGQRGAEGQAIAATLPEKASENRLQELLDRLDAIRREEEQVLREVKEILAADKK